MQVSVVISRNLAEGASPAGQSRWDLESALAGYCAATAGLNVLLIPHAYHLPEDSGLWQTLAALPAPLVFISWLYPRPAEWLLKAHGIGQGGLACLCLADYASAEEAHAAVLAGCAALPEPARTQDAVSPGGALDERTEPIAARWYPVKDGARCTHCQQCLQFCLFGVYELGPAGNVTVAHPERCKAGCPACSRICPHGAIIFPLYARDEAIAGAPGRLMAPDAAARRMFYQRTKRPCPVCGATADAPGRGSGGFCEECGRPSAPAGPPPDETPAILRDDLDALLDDLDALTKRQG